MQFDYDLIVIGAGSGGVRTARLAAQSGAKVALIEGSDIGGTCVNVGCVPKKLYSYASYYGEYIQEAKGYGWSIPEASFDFEVLKQRRAQEIKRLNGIYASQQQKAGTHMIEGWGKVIDKHTVQVNDADKITAKNIVIAVGGWPFVPDIEGKEHAITSNEIFDIPFPKRLVIVGGGYIAAEFASIFNSLGSDVKLVYRGQKILRGFDEDLRSFVSEEMQKSGVDFLCGNNVKKITKQGDEFIAHLESGDSIVCDQVFFATGRKPRTQNLGLENAGVELDKNGSVVVDQNFQSNVDSIYALGDVISRVQLTPVAINEGVVLHNHLFGDKSRQMSYEYIPTAVFTHPELGTVGYTEEQAREKFKDIDVYKSNFKPMKHTLSGHDVRSLMKIIVDKASDRVVGLHLGGADSAEMLQGFAVAIKHGATKADFDSTIGIHPSSAEELVTMRTPE
ncbi:glutathione-disulfide reductase [Brackiella oedipodis]|uniref:glutathione-disulfide reductase n=1 Tax=Brackiella oedipodis TaxID=124225 RepID=UPI00048C7178|nr:glutathione-disulfide reductase [Brackiella oedipodis]